MPRAQAPRTYILTGAICEAVKAPPASTHFRGGKEEASEQPSPALRLLLRVTQPRCTLLPNVKHVCTRKPLCLSRYLLRMNAREIFLTAGPPGHLIKSAPTCRYVKGRETGKGRTGGGRERGATVRYAYAYAPGTQLKVTLSSARSSSPISHPARSDAEVRKSAVIPHSFASQCLS